MKNDLLLRIGETSENGQVTIVDEDRLCYIVRSEGKGAVGLRTISKALLKEYIPYVETHPDATREEARDALRGKSEIDKFEYGYGPTIISLAKMVIEKRKGVILPFDASVKGSATTNSSLIHFIAALKTKPFLLLAGISGTGKSRIVRQLAYATGGENPEAVQRPFNFEMIQVRPNWHDSSDLLGYVTRVSGKAEYVMTDFVRFLAKAWYFEGEPFFLCLDEMNLAPVEQYFAEYLSVLETRKLRDGKIVSDPLIPALDGLDGKKNGFRVSDPMLDDMFGHEWIKDGDVVDIDKQKEDKLRLQFRKEGIALPPNLFVVGTVNMDETTFSFSRKVLDRAMTIEMNVVNLRSGLTKESLLPEQIDKTLVLPNAVEAADVYDGGNQTCELTLQYLESINNCLEGTPFKIAYRTRNEFLVYVVHRVGMTEGDKCKALISALDEMTFMKILSRIEGDKKKLTDKDGNPLLEKLEETVSKALSMAKENYKSEGNQMVEMPSSQSIAKLGMMKQKLEKNYYCTFWD
mgnify:FL=1